MPPKVTGTRVLSGEKGSPYGMGKPGRQVIGARGGMAPPSKAGKGGPPAPPPRPTPAPGGGRPPATGSEGLRMLDPDTGELRPTPAPVRGKRKS
jgi:hypothetical protein